MLLYVLLTYNNNLILFITPSRHNPCRMAYVKLNRNLTDNLIVIRNAEIQSVGVKEVEHAGSAVALTINVPCIFWRKIVGVVNHIGNEALQVAFCWAYYVGCRIQSVPTANVQLIAWTQ